MNSCLLEHKPRQLYHLRPMGLGTVNVESITGYIKRLAFAHMVSVGNLIRKEIIPAMIKDNLTVNDFVGDKCSSLNNLSSTSLEVVNILEIKTYNTGLLQLTMNPWEDFLHPYKIYRKWHAWCPICYEERLQLEGIVYDELIWNFKDVNICKRHQVMLAQNCPCCGSRVRIMSSLSRVGFCDKCSSWLGLKSYKEYNNPVTNSKWENWVYDNIGSLLISNPILCDFDSGQFKKNIFYIIASRNLSMRSFGQEYNISNSTLQSWSSGNEPALNAALKLAFQLGYTILELLIDKIELNKRELNAEYLPNLKQKKIVDIEKIKLSLDEAILSGNLISLAAFCKDNKVCTRTVKAYFPREADYLINNYKQYLIERKVKKSKTIKQVMHELHERGEYPGRKPIFRETGKNLITSSEDRKVWIDTLKELGYTIAKPTCHH